MNTAPRRSTPTLNIIGAGRVGRTLGRLWQDAGVFTLGDVAARSAASARAAVAFIGAGRATHSLTGLAPADVYLLSVPDREIAATARIIAAQPGLPEKAIAVHCSGALASQELAALGALGWRVASAHPALSFADPERAVAQFSGCLCGLEGDPRPARCLAACSPESAPAASNSPPSTSCSITPARCSPRISPRCSSTSR